ncbi:MAG TPA: glycosyl hydrolase [Solirubrobacteraceae bacterium]|nr:glycosyl hydrolase [Solirubrobacteraceae bacterium]
MSYRRLALFVLPIALLLGLPSSGQAYITGIGDQQASMFASPLFQALHPKIARLIVAYDVMNDSRAVAATRDWLAAAKAQNIEPLVSFYHSQRTPTHIPSVHTYTDDVKKFIKAFPGVTEYQPWNEVNRGNVSAGPFKFHSPTAQQSAAFYDALLGVCSGCTVVGLDVLDSQHLSATLKYISDFKKAVKHMPHLWGLHNYTDTNRFQNKTTRAVSAAVPGKLWLTETGGIVKFGHSFPNKHHSGEKRAAKALSYMFKLANANSKIDRLYIFQWTGSGPHVRFDAGLMNPNGSPRPGYFTVRKQLIGH